MKNLMLSAIGAGVLAIAATAAHAAGGCGAGWHRGFYGGCRPTYGAYYPGVGYWNGYHYWHHRHWNGYRWHYW